MKLDEEVYWWWKDNQADCQHWFVLQDLLHAQYVSHFERPQFSDLVIECKEILASVGNMLENMDAKGADTEPPALVEPKVVAELTLFQEEISSQSIEVEKLPNEALVNLLAEPN